MKESLENREMKFLLEDEPDEDEGLPYDDIIASLQEAIDYAKGKTPAYVTKYEDGKRISAQWQMVDGTKVEPPPYLLDYPNRSE